VGSAVRALVVTVDFLKTQIDELQSLVSCGYSRGRYGPKGDREENEKCPR
jgi:hypothetical protein